MKNVLLYASLVSLLTASCKQSNPEPAQSIEGTYQATFYDRSTDAIAYPINGQQLSLQIKYVSADTVSVQITPSSTISALPSGIYSPTQTLFYHKAYVQSSANAATYIYLSGKPGDPVSTRSAQIWLYKGRQSADYFFAPQQTPNIAKAIRFERK